MFVALTLALLLVACAAVRGNGDDDGQAALPNFAKMRVKELKALLAERGVECKGCSEKSHIIDAVKANYHLPVLQSDAEEEQEAEAAAEAEAASSDAAADGAAASGDDGAAGSDDGPRVFDPADSTDPEVEELVKKLRTKKENKGIDEDLLKKLRESGKVSI